MNCILLTAFLMLASLSCASAALRETKAQVEVRYGKPVKIAGYPTDRRCTYRFGRYEVDVTYRDGISIAESYRTMDTDSNLTADEVEKFLRLNSAGMTWEKKAEGSWVRANSPVDLAKGVVAFFHRSLLIGIINPAPASNAGHRGGERREITGIATMKKWERRRVLVIRNRDEVVEIPWGNDNIDKGADVSNGETCTATMLDTDSRNLDGPIAFVSDREHSSFDDALDDARFYHLLQVKDGNEVVFDATHKK